MSSVEIIPVLAAFAAGGSLGFWLAERRARKEVETLAVRIAALEARIEAPAHDR